MKLHVEFDVEVPDDMPIDAACEWIAFCCGDNGIMTPRHPKMNEDMEPVRGSLDIR